MPTPIEILFDPISLLILALYGALLTLEAWFPGRKLPQIPGARLRGFSSFFVFFYVATYLPLLWDGFLGQFRLFDLTALHWSLGAVLGLLAYEFVAYWYHRLLHRFDLLFQGIHQMHHSAERLDGWSAFFFGPWDMVGWSLVGSLGLVVLVGLSPLSATIALVAINFLGIFQHTNIRTPRVLGYLIQRPESHTIHHGRGVHAYNYADLPVFDMIFGTFNNPAGFEMPTGYYDGASTRVWDMILMRDVTHLPARVPPGGVPKRGVSARGVPKRGAAWSASADADPEAPPSSVSPTLS